MLKAARSPLTILGLSVAVSVALAAFLVPGSLRGLFSTGYFMPHVHCYLDDPRMIWLQGLSDALIGLSYMAISGALGYLVYRARRDVPFEWMFLAFGIFIFSCGWTHFLEVWTLWHPTYWLSGTIKAVTAVASIATAIGIAPLVPRALQLIELAKTSERRRQELEQTHREMEAMNRKLLELDELKSQFIANVSHELRTPLTLILGNIERLQEAHNLTPEQRRSLGVVERNGLVLHQQVNNLLDSAKLESGQMQLHYADTDLGTLVRLVCSNFESLGADRHLHFTVEAPTAVPIQADAQKLEQVLVNLLSNAFKFTPQGGRIRCTVRSAAAEALVEVADTGPGIPAESRAAIFERFRQLDPKSSQRFAGTGLGLCIARDFVLLHGGKLEAGDSPEGGALFTVRLPRQAPEGTAVQPARAATAQSPPAREALAQLARTPSVAPAQPPPGGAGEGVVLVVEDNPDMIELIRDTLSPHYRTIPAANGAEGLDKARASQPDLILTDLMMPEMGGEQFLQRLRAEKAFDPVPVVVLTARADEHVRVQLLREGAQDYLLKPFTREELRARAGNLVAARRSRQDLERANQELEAFSYSLAHDLRTPLRSIRSFAQMLSEDYTPPAGSEAGLFLQNIISSAQRLDQLVSDVLAYTLIERTPSRLHLIQLEPLLRTLVQETQDFQPPRAEVVLRIPLHPVMGHEASLTQVIANLLSNAVKFVAPGATPRVEVSSELLDGRVRIWFKDNGIGIDPRDHERIFGLFQRLHSERAYSGTGLGLAIVRKAVERMGGRIGLESALGQGSRFWIELNCAETAPQDTLGETCVTAQ